MIGPFDVSLDPAALGLALPQEVAREELGQDEFTFYDENKTKITKRTDYLSLDGLLEKDTSYDKYRNWFNRQKCKFDRSKSQY